MSILWIAIIAIALQRLGTLFYSIKNTRTMLEHGGIEVGRFQFPLIALTQFAWLISMAIFIPNNQAPIWLLLGICVLVELFHTWAIITLGPFWTTRVILVPGARLINRGPYRLFRHPNYLAVFVEIVLLPATFHAYGIAIVFGVLYAVLVYWRIGDEDRLLATAREISAPRGHIRGKYIAP